MIYKTRFLKSKFQMVNTSHFAVKIPYFCYIVCGIKYVIKIKLKLAFAVSGVLYNNIKKLLCQT